MAGFSERAIVPYPNAASRLALFLIGRRLASQVFPSEFVRPNRKNATVNSRQDQQKSVHFAFIPNPRNAEPLYSRANSQSACISSIRFESYKIAQARHEKSSSSDALRDPRNTMYPTDTTNATAKRRSFSLAPRVTPCPVSPPRPQNRLAPPHSSLRENRACCPVGVCGHREPERRCARRTLDSGR